MTRPRRASASSSSSAAHRGVERPSRFLGRDEVITLLGEIQRRFEWRDDLQQRGVELAQPPGERPFELIERHARLERRDRLDQIANRFGLHQVHSPVQESAERELTGIGDARAPLDSGGDDGVEDHRAAVRRQLDDVVAGVGMRTPGSA